MSQLGHPPGLDYKAIISGKSFIHALMWPINLLIWPCPISAPPVGAYLLSWLHKTTPRSLLFIESMTPTVIYEKWKIYNEVR